MSAPVQHSLGRLRTKMLHAAKTFPDYNFRTYFVRQVKEQFVEIGKWTLEDQKRFLTQDGARKLEEMRRMALVNRLYAAQPVFLDRRAGKSHSPSATQTAASKGTGV